MPERLLQRGHIERIYTASLTTQRKPKASFEEGWKRTKFKDLTALQK